MKIVSDAYGTFMQGWTRCSLCNKRIKYRLDVSVGMTMIAEYELCKTCMWEAAEQSSFIILFKVVK